MSRDDLARRAVRAAARVRTELGVGPAEGVCPFDLAAGLDVLARIVSLPTLEGVYSPEPTPTIVVSSERPVGRRRFTCAHELGHHVFGHGTRLEDLPEEATRSWSSEEYLAQRFAAALMMPKLAVESAFARREWTAAQASPESVFIVAQELGVGFSTLIGHLERTMNALSESAADRLRQSRLGNLRNRLAGFDVAHDLVVLDRHWAHRTVDIEVGDIVIVPTSAVFEGGCATVRGQPVQHLVAERTGIGNLAIDPQGQGRSVRVSRRGFTDLARYRYLEEVADDE